VLARPQVVQYARVPIKGFEAEKEKLEIKETGLVTAEEVIAGHQRFMATRTTASPLQRRRPPHYHAKLGGSDTIDISYDNTFFKEQGTGAEWEQKALYFNGVRWKGKDLPELPIPSPRRSSPAAGHQPQPGLCVRVRRPRQGRGV